MQMINGI